MSPCWIVCELTVSLPRVLNKAGYVTEIIAELVLLSNTPSAASSFLWRDVCMLRRLQNIIFGILGRRTNSDQQPLGSCSVRLAPDHSHGEDQASRSKCSGIQVPPLQGRESSLASYVNRLYHCSPQYFKPHYLVSLRKNNLTPLGAQ